MPAARFSFLLLMNHESNKSLLKFSEAMLCPINDDHKLMGQNKCLKQVCGNGECDNLIESPLVLRVSVVTW